MVCPSESQLASHVAGELDASEHTAIGAHLDECDACRQVAVVVAGMDYRAALVPARYEITRKLGEGGMGVVYAAFDRELAREVAIKVIRSDRANPGVVERTLRESRVMASIRHPSVVTVFDVGRMGDQVYVAMELVDGVTLRAWLSAKRRPWRVVLDIFARAARGFAAAHAAGIVHRDVKPDNILIAEEAGAVRVAVTDFGIARTLADAREPIVTTEPEVAVTTPPGVEVTSLTATGVAIGTPAYMAPEQLAAETVDARADVFALGVTLWEALFGRRPYGGSTAKAIASAMLDGAPQPPQRVGPAIDRVPAWVARAARAAIEPDPDRRTPSMAAFVASIDVGRRDRRRNAAVVAGVALVLGGGAFALGFTRSGDAADPCTATANLVDQVWTPAREAAIERAFTAAAPEFGTTSAQRLVAGARAWTADWKLVRRAACAGPAAERARRDACLDRALAALAARADLWAAADEGVVLSTRGRTDLPVVALCASPPPRSEPLPPTLARIDDQFERVDALEYGGRHAEALEKLAAVRAELDRTTNPTFLAHAGMIAGAVLHNDGALDDALRLYDRAGAAAATIGDANATMRLLALQANALVDKGDPAAALVAINAATRVHELAQVPDPMAVIGTTRGRILLESGRGPEAITELEAAARTLAATAVTNRDANVVLAMALATQAYAMRERVERGELERSLATYAQARALVVAELGAEHPEVARIDGERALVLSDLGRGDEATALAREALAELRAAFGPGHPLVGASLVNLASLERVAGHAAAARAAADEARPILTAVLPPEHPTFAVLDTTIAKLELVDGRLPEAEAWARAAIERFDAADIGGDQLADPLLALGRILVARGRPADAVPVLQRAVIELADPSLGASRLEALLALGDALVHARRPGDARATLQEAATLAGTLELAGPDGDALRAQLAALEKALS